MQPNDTAVFWKKCNSCKKPIGFNALYWVCNVSTCNRVRTGLSFCSVSCWDAHLPLMNHREAWAEERRSPSEEEWKKTLSGEDAPVRRRRTAKAEPAPAEPEAAALAKPPAVILRRKGSS
ncbi:MAG: hypothetical protein NDJ90_09150 [Oligoflexia bacterium]|nr:hypothetical protein [Oligoflexia bacterium]